MNDFSQYVPNVTFEQIPIKNLVANQEYQRNLSFKHVEKAAKDFNLYQINPVKVSRRDGVNYVFNGQHTIEIVALVSGSRDTPVWCMVYDDLYYEEEADIFANQLKYTRPLAPYEIFMANIEAGNDRQLIIKELIESYGMFISPRPCTGGICAVGALEFIYNKYGLSNLQRTLNLCIGTWEGERDAFSANMLKAVALIVSEFDKALKDDIFKSKLGKVSVKEISRAAAERRNGTSGYADAIMTYYNKRMKVPLHSDKITRKMVIYSVSEIKEAMPET